MFELYARITKIILNHDLIKKYNQTYLKLPYTISNNYQAYTSFMLIIDKK